MLYLVVGKYLSQVKWPSCCLRDEGTGVVWQAINLKNALGKEKNWFFRPGSFHHVMFTSKVTQRKRSHAKIIYNCLLFFCGYKTW